MKPCTREFIGMMFRLIWALSVYSTLPKCMNFEQTHVSSLRIIAITMMLRNIFLFFLFIIIFDYLIIVFSEPVE